MESPSLPFTSGSGRTITWLDFGYAGSDQPTRSLQDILVSLLVFFLPSLPDRTLSVVQPVLLKCYKFLTSRNLQTVSSVPVPFWRTCLPESGPQVVTDWTFGPIHFYSTLQYLVVYLGGAQQQSWLVEAPALVKVVSCFLRLYHYWLKTGKRITPVGICFLERGVKVPEVLWHGKSTDTCKIFSFNI